MDSVLFDKHWPWGISTMRSAMSTSPRKKWRYVGACTECGTTGNSIDGIFNIFRDLQTEKVQKPLKIRFFSKNIFQKKKQDFFQNFFQFFLFFFVFFRVRDDEKTPFGVPNKSVTLSKMVILEEQCSTSCAAFLEGKHKILNKFSYENWFFWICQKKYKRFFGKSAVNQWIDYFDFAEKKFSSFWALPSIQKMTYIFCRYVVVLDRPAFDLYITYSVYYGTILKMSRWSIFKEGMATTWSSLDRPWNSGTMKGRSK